MDAGQFDGLAKLLSESEPRRRVLQGLLSGALAVIPGARHHARAVARRCTKVGKRCGTNGDCCSGFCEPISRQCVARCSQEDAGCGRLSPCAKGCSCYSVELREPFAGRACLRNPTKDLTTPGQECPGTAQCSPEALDRGVCPCSGPADCPRGYLCTGASCCWPDSVCLRVCDPDVA